MRTIDVKEIIEKHQLDAKEVAQQLFPGNKYPKLALNRVMAGSAQLDANQMSKLALLIGVQVSDLYSGSEWKATSKKDLISFSSGSYRAELNTKTWITKIFDNDSLFHESVIHAGSTALSEYLNELNLIISKHKKDESSRN
jgi:hypothetical protein